MRGQDDTHLRAHVKHKRNHFMFNRNINPKQAKCYLDRYPDLSQALKGNLLEGAARHWRQFGYKEKRNKFCMPDMDDDMAQCYLNRYSDVSAIED
jgi:hypothetical protein